MLETATINNSNNTPIIPIGDDSSEIVLAENLDNRQFCVLYVGDILTVRQKAASLYRLGGKLYNRNDFKTVPNGMLVSCQLTRLRSWMESVPVGLLNPENLDRYESTYILKNQYDAGTQTYKDVQIGGTEATKHLVYWRVKPAYEIGMVAHREQDGAVEVNANLNSVADIKDAQLHYFPNWASIMIGSDVLPSTLRRLEDHIRERQVLARSADLVAVGDAFLLACQDYRQWAMNYIAKQTEVIEETRGKGRSFTYDEIAERLFKYVELTRNDKLVEGFAQDRADVAATQSEMAKAVALLAQIAKDQHNAFLSNAPDRAVAAPPPTNEDEALTRFEQDNSERIEVPASDMSEMTIKNLVGNDEDSAVVKEPKQVKPKRASGEIVYDDLDLTPSRKKKEESGG